MRLEVIKESVRAGTHSDSWRERVPDFSKCSAEKVLNEVETNVLLVLRSLNCFSALVV